VAREMRIVIVERDGVFNLAGALDTSTVTRLDRWTLSPSALRPLAFEAGATTSSISAS
jgi:hypothetical protein